MEYHARVCFLSAVFTSRFVGKFAISLDLRSHEISNFSMHLKVNTADRKHTLL